jgi:hypothetical protein
MKVFGPFEFSAGEARAAMAGHKTQARVPAVDYTSGEGRRSKFAACTSGDLIWCSEPFIHITVRRKEGLSGTAYGSPADYQTPDHLKAHADRKIAVCQAAAMARFQSRLTLELVRVARERVYNISEADAIAEGFSRQSMFGQTGFALPAKVIYRFYDTAAQAFREEWTRETWRKRSLSGECIALTFKVHVVNVDRYSRGDAENAEARA